MRNSAGVSAPGPRNEVRRGRAPVATSSARAVSASAHGAALLGEIEARRQRLAGGDRLVAAAQADAQVDQRLGSRQARGGIAQELHGLTELRQPLRTAVEPAARRERKRLAPGRAEGDGAVKLAPGDRGGLLGAAEPGQRSHRDGRPLDEHAEVAAGRRHPPVGLEHVRDAGVELARGDPHPSALGQHPDALPHPQLALAEREGVEDRARLIDAPALGQDRDEEHRREVRRADLARELEGALGVILGLVELTQAQRCDAADRGGVHEHRRRAPALGLGQTDRLSGGGVVELLGPGQRARRSAVGDEVAQQPLVTQRPPRQPRRLEGRQAGDDARRGQRGEHQRIGHVAVARAERTMAECAR